MKAAQLLRYSKTSTDLTINDIAKPKPKADEILVKVKAAGVNPVDNMITAGDVKLIVPYDLPLTAGNEFAGIVEETGSQVTQFKAGDRVYARMPLEKTGAFAEYLTISEKEVALIPDYLTFEEAATVPLTALTAYQALDLLKVEAGKTIFISGGTGGFGAVAIPLAKAHGLKVITNGGARNEARVRELGVDQFIDYQKEDYTKVLSNVDYVIDTLGGQELDKQFSILKKGGSLVTLRGVPNKAFAQSMGLSGFKQFLFGLVGRKYDKLAAKNDQTYHFIFVQSNGQQLTEISQIFQEKQVPTSIDTIYDFEEVNKALDKVKNGRSQGKTIVTFKD
ncbi:NADP-dependent oxidoreductase [Streptococcus saliviloxodontae]|uniref:NADPH:quinone reductase-like Zn-dependent oxidoreductase n=1 Tax=Streptococcus saliviloxodontae TaxID=1349416 RepID=A0ABS2PMK3_9STRE|nr:NADP-dependent oxidoreductase [Streptococcus saliviloxodontae]MBM7636669.1 NADPH:quinone reductase-like Zn-dependent oxidoreductase [Streptococcus saliviloxodontae]